MSKDLVLGKSRLDDPEAVLANGNNPISPFPKEGPVDRAEARHQEIMKVLHEILEAVKNTCA